MANDRRDDGDHARDRYHDRDEAHRESRDGRDRDNSPSDRRNRSRSPRRERGDRGRYRSRSPLRRNGRNDRRYDRDERSPRDSRFGRDVPKAPRGAPSGPRKDSRSDAGPVRPPGARAAAEQAETQNTVMDHEQLRRERPEGMDDETWAIAQTMGFARFKSTKNKKVPGNDKNYGVRKDKVRKARQYMNRQGGFNRPLSPSRT